MMMVVIERRLEAEDLLQHIPIDLARRPLALNPAVLQAQNVMRVLGDNRQIVRDQKNSDAALDVDARDELVEAFLVLEVDALRRLVEEQQRSEERRVGKEGRSRGSTYEY